MKITYIGHFPPPYGGVTIKNKMLFDNLEEYVTIEKINLGLVKKKNFVEVFKLFTALINPSNVLIIGSASTSRRLFSKFLYHINRRTLNRSLLIIMGGISSRIISNDPKYLKWVSEYKQIYVETEGMMSELTEKGMENVTVFPNCREKPDKEFLIKNSSGKIKCVFFSLVSLEKGVDNILDAVAILDSKGIDYNIDFYGHIESQFEEQFNSLISLNVNINYCGVFESVGKYDVYEKLSQYDILLFPTKWKYEGVPGILVEAKIVGLPAIVSDLNFNSEIVENGRNGIVLNHNTPEELADAIEYLYLNKDYLLELKNNAFLSSQNYLIDNYIEDMVNILQSSPY